MHILFLIPSLERGGAERQLVELAKGLRIAGHSPEVAVFYGGGSLEGELDTVGVPIHSLGKASRWDMRFLWRLLRLVRGLRPDVVHSYLGTPNQLAGLLRPLMGMVPVVWGVRSAFMDMSRYDWLSRLSSRVSPLLSTCSSAVIVNSEAGRAHASRMGYRADRLRVVANGIDCERLRHDGEGRLRWRQRWKVAGEQLVVGVVGRLDPMKDHPTFLRAAGLVARDEPRTRFVCVGSGMPEHRQALHDMASHAGLDRQLIWEPATDDVRGVYSALDILVLSSYGESFPNVVAEAMACGTPCVVTDVGDASLIVGETGLVVPPSSAEDLASAMGRALAWSEVERRRRGAAARARVEASFSVPALVRHTVDVLDEVLQPRTGAAR